MGPKKKGYITISLILILLSTSLNIILVKPTSMGTPATNSVDANDNIFNQVEEPRILQNLNKFAGLFTANYGQVENDEVRFYIQGGGLWFTDEGVWFELREYAEPRDRGLGIGGQGGVRDELLFNSQQSAVDCPELRLMTGLMTDDYRLTTNEYKRVVLKQEFVGASPVKPVGRGQLSWDSNFFYGNDPLKWRTEVPNYQEIYYENLYNGIDLRYYTNEHGLKYDFIVHPGADPDLIRLKYYGIDGLELNKPGNLIIRTPIENLIDSDLFIYQDYSGSRRPVSGLFIILNKSEFGFKILDDYNRQENLIIDPLIYSTFIGGIENESGSAIAVDSNGNAYITGWTHSSDFPTTPGALNDSFIGGTDAFIFKLNPNGSTPVYSTYIQGGGVNRATDIKVDSKGFAFITGYTRSPNFPTTPNAYNRTITGGFDCFVLKLDQIGSSLIYSTLIGSEEDDYGNGLVIDAIDNAYVTGITYKCEIHSNMNFPTTPGAFDETHPGISPESSYCTFVFKLNYNGSTLLYSTFLGGSIRGFGDDIAVDQAGNVYVIGYSISADFPTTPGAYDSSYDGTFSEVFVSKLNLSGLGFADLIYSTFVGGSDYEFGRSIKLDKAGNIIVCGDTFSFDFPTTTGAFDQTHNGITYNSDCFIFKLNQNMSKLIFSTFVGGNMNDTGTDIAVDTNGDIYITGLTNSSNFPVTYNAYDKTYNNTDIFLCKLSQDSGFLNYSTFIGGSNDESFYSGMPAEGFYYYLGNIGMWVNDQGEIYLTGHTLSPDFPTTAGAFDRVYNGNSDVFVLKFTLPKILEINSLELLRNNIPNTTAYSKADVYTFRVELSDTISPIDLNSVRLTLDINGTNIRLFWDRITGTFIKEFDPNNYLILEQSSIAYKNSWSNWTIDFNVTFNWTYPDEHLQDVQAFATSAVLSPAWLNVTDKFRVENDLVFNGTLSVKDEDDRYLDNYDLVRGGEVLNWTGLKVVYENTTELYPPEYEFNITIWDDSGNFWEASPDSGAPFVLNTIAALDTNLDGALHIINLTGIPPDCDKTNKSFIIKIDGDNVTFSNPKPDNETWHTDTAVEVGIIITDHGGGLVDGTNVIHAVSIDNGTIWSECISVPDVADEANIETETITIFEDGTDNFIKWLAFDTLGNGPAESEPYHVLVDTKRVIFSDPWPVETYVSPTQEVEVGITIFDNTSGVNASTIEYSISENGGRTWNSWTPVTGFEDGKTIEVRLNLTFANGTKNRIRWRATDIAGNGPTRSGIYQVRINTWLQTFIPRVRLLNPMNNTVVPTEYIKLSWMLENENLLGVAYDVFFDTVNPPIELKGPGLLTTSFIVNGLTDGETYYWTIVPKTETAEGWCVSEVWSFTVNTNVPFPMVNLKHPENGSIIRSLLPTLVWLVDYEGTEAVIYDVFIDTNENPQTAVSDHQEPYYLPEKPLEDNTTYYWKVIPSAGGIQGPESEIWSFTVKKDYIPRFELKLVLEPAVIGLEPGETKYVKAYVRNAGELTDIISLGIEVPADAKIEAAVNESSTRELPKDDVAVFNITVTAEKNAGNNEYLLTVSAVSENAAEYDMVVEEKALLKVVILGADKSGRDKYSTMGWIIFIVLMIIIIVLIIMVLYIKRRKRSKQESAAAETVTIKPIETPTLDKLKGDTATEPTAAKLPETSAVAPQLASPKAMGQTLEPQQMPEIAEKPQLPPAAEPTEQITAEPISEQSPSSTSTGESQQQPAAPQIMEPSGTNHMTEHSEEGKAKEEIIKEGEKKDEV